MKTLLLIFSPTIYTIVFLLVFASIHSYETNIYEADCKTYNAEKALFDSLETVRVKHEYDSLFAEWTSTHDTTLREIKKISKQPNYTPYGYNKKTGKYKCERNWHDTFICEPITEFVITGYERDGYYMDTTWTDHPYKTRNEWLSEYNSHAKYSGIERTQFKPYDGHKKDYITNADKTTLYDIVFWAALIIGFIIWFACAYTLGDNRFVTFIEIIMPGIIIIMVCWLFN